MIPSKQNYIDRNRLPKKYQRNRLPKKEGFNIDRKSCALPHPLKKPTTKIWNHWYYVLNAY